MADTELPDPKTDSGSERELLFQSVAHGKVRPLLGYLDAGVDVNSRDAFKQTPLMCAVYLKREDVRSHVVRLLLGHGADVNLQDENGRTVLMHACANAGRDDVVRLVIRTGRCQTNKADLSGNTALVHAVVAANAAAIRILVNSAHTKPNINVDQANSRGTRPLSLAVKLRQPDCCKVLVREGGADPALVADRAILEALLQTETYHPAPLPHNQRPRATPGPPTHLTTRRETIHGRMDPIYESQLEPPDPLEKYSLSPRGSFHGGPGRGGDRLLLSVDSLTLGERLEPGALTPPATFASSSDSLNLPPLSPSACKTPPHPFPMGPGGEGPRRHSLPVTRLEGVGSGGKGVGGALLPLLRLPEDGLACEEV